MAGTGSYVAGLQGGYNYVFPSRLMLGFEADVSFPNSDVLVPYSVRGSQTITSPLTGQVTLWRGGHPLRQRPRPHRLCVRPFSALWNGRIGLELRSGDADPGRRFSRRRFRNHRDRRHRGCCGGWDGRPAPVSKSRSPETGRQRPNFCPPDLATWARPFRPDARATDSDLAMQSIRLGLNYKIGGDDSPHPGLPDQGPSALETDSFAFHAQATYLNQYDPSVQGSLQRQKQSRAEHRPRDRRHHLVRRRPALAGRRSLDHAGNRSGLWIELIGRRRGISERRGLQGRRGLSLHASAPGFPAADHRPRRRGPESRCRANPVFRIANLGPAGVHGRKIQRRRYLRYQQIRP